MNFEYNMNEDRRNELLKDYLSTKILYDVMYFKDLPLKAMESLYNEKFIDPNDNQNGSPTAVEFIEFVQKYPFVKFHGYTVSKNRKDYRTTIEGLNYKGPVDETHYPNFVKDFIVLNKRADELNYEDNKFFSWFD
jgi:hypothetical protein